MGPPKKLEETLLPVERVMVTGGAWIPKLKQMAKR